ncbi:SIR2-like domain-containing protein [Enterovibrio nigricans DSM 22720]|uniref:SIR2-like domain-containing protein n=1 Tax=Enterovibrio nigricans DSM 22720 TaxID=1121868 RepID=A0A1T4VXI9_9GAMM|nr:SIR2-like domain-containing protein [Enterovibrio nigricans DSM 22720]
MNDISLMHCIYSVFYGWKEVKDLIDDDLFIQIEGHLKCSELSWLLGAGISFDAKLPLMYPLTNKVKKDLKAGSREIYDKIVSPLFTELSADCHIEHILSHLGDYAALAERSKDKKVNINKTDIVLDELIKAHGLILDSISNVIRSGYVEGKNGEQDQEGTLSKPIVEIDSHLDFIDALFNHAGAGIYERRKSVNIFTTNYDTLLEDALALNKIPYWDGFSGGALAYRTQRYGEPVPISGQRANLIKMHGSIDWYLCDKGYVWRVRDNDLYPKVDRRVLIYPQATKYIATQQDPFSAQFDLFRKSLNSQNSNVLAVCGYSFGDDHINNEIEFAMSKEDNKTVLVAFLECRKEIPRCLENWRSSRFGQRVIIASLHGIYVGEKGPFERIDGEDYWWTFKGVTSVLKNGCEA